MLIACTKTEILYSPEVAMSKVAKIFTERLIQGRASMPMLDPARGELARIPHLLQIPRSVQKTNKNTKTGNRSALRP